MKLNPCPFCGEDKAYIIVCDDEGNLKGKLGCAYESDPWSGLSYGLFHAGVGECILCNEEDYSPLGNLLFDTAEEAIEAWNRRVDDDE